MSRGLRALLAALLLAAAPAAAQGEKPRKNDPSLCPYCHGKPELMEPAGIVSHGSFEFGTENTGEADAFLATADVRWIESEHFEIGFALGPYKVTQREKNKLRAELAELAQVLPEVDARAKLLDPWLRSHLFAQRVEKVWDRFLGIVQKEEGDFPRGNAIWVLGTPYMGEGRYVGQKGKYEILFLETEAEHVAYLRDQFGLSIKRTQRWNVIERDSLTTTMHIRQGRLRVDEALHGHVAFNLAHNLLDGYKHYSYDTPLWIHEGLAHLLEREITTRYNTFDATEGAIAEETRKARWIPEVKKMIQSGKAPRMAELINLRSYAEFALEHHFATWSMTDFLIREHPDGYACLQDRIHGRKNAEGMPNGSNLKDVHREAFQECLGMGYARFDQAWREWVMALVDRKD